MTTITNTDIPILATKVHVVDHRAESNGSIKSSSLIEGQIAILQYHSSFSKLIGSSPTHSLLLSTKETTNNPFFHEACVYLPTHEELYITSNLLQSTTSSAYPSILISRLKITRASPDNELSQDGNAISKIEWAKLRPPLGIDMPNGGVNYKSDSILFCAQGSPSPGTGGIYLMSRTSPPVPLVTNFYGRDFNSVNDVVVARDGSVWFTDPCYGFEQGFRRRPELPNQVYRYNVNGDDNGEGKGELRVVASGFERCNGIAFSPGEETVYITDTGYIHGDGDKSFLRPATIYAFDITHSSGSPFLTNRRIFAFAASGVPDGIKCDTAGNVYAGCGDGIEVWNLRGSLIGRIIVPGGCANFCFGKEGEIFVCNETRLWRVKIEARGALLGI